MRFQKFQQIMSPERMQRYVDACNGNTRKAMTLYRRNLQLSQELFTIISCFEVALRNAINNHFINQHGANWLFNAAQPGGFFDSNRTRITCNLINTSINKLGARFTHSKLVASLGFGFWRYMFGPNQYRLAGQSLLRIFPNRPMSSPQQQYNANYIFRQLQKVNNIRNRIAHHEPICFQNGTATIDAGYVKEHYDLIIQLFNWMDINESDLLFGIDHVDNVIRQIRSI